MKDNSLQIRLSSRRKHKLMLYAAQEDKTITALIEEWIDNLILTKERETQGFNPVDRVSSPG